MKREWAIRIGLILGAIVLTLGTLEIGLRLIQGGWITSWPNFVLESRKVQATRNESRYVEDPTLGYVPRPNYSAAGLSVDAEGFRRSAATPDGRVAPDGGAILALGDSFTFGEEVKDDETWPAYLQQLLGRRVLNAGVSGYGFDQIVMRAERTVPDNHPSAIVVSFIADDIRRTEMARRWSAEKPYFDIQNGALALRNVPIPRPDPNASLGFFERTLGYSFLLDFILERLDGIDRWHGDHVRVHPPGTGEKISCLLTRRLADLQRRSGARVLVVAQYDPFVWRDASFAAEQRRLTKGLLDCSRQQGLDVLDTFDALAANGGKGSPGSLYGEWHMNDEGNRLTAGAIAAALGSVGN
jgi:lysophospholipase L1-like esterase